MGDTIIALVLRQEADTINAEIEELDNDDLPPGDVIIKVDYSSLNYKDGMALTGKGNIIRSYPMVPGIDLVGSVLASDSEKFLPGDPVILTGWSVGERYWGGFTQRQGTHADWFERRPAALDARDAIVPADAGFPTLNCFMAGHGGGSEVPLNPCLDYLTQQSMSVAFRSDVEAAINKANFTYEKDFRVDPFICDFLLRVNGKRYAIDCKYNVNRDWDRTDATVKLLKENLPCDEVVIAIPYENELARNARTEIESAGGTIA
jgi:NADPH:quinone reductase and related Zn-dependent oxidoreductases